MTVVITKNKTKFCLTTFLRLTPDSFKQDGGIKKEEEKDKKSLKATVIINNAPICHTHSLLVPFLDECWPQVLNHQGLATAVHAILLSKSA